ncbi:ABC transporter substrate-binding protein, partial [Halomonas sp. SUBG004]
MPAAVSEPATPDAPEAVTQPSPQALLKQWYQRYPHAFFKGHTKPLKVGIHQDLAEREPWPSKLIRRALANYVNLPRYTKSMREGAERVDLDGQPAGKVDKEAAKHA